MQKIALVLMPGFHVMSLATLAAFEMANQSAPKPAYEVSVLSEHGGLVPASLPGVVMQTMAFDDGEYDSVIFGGGLEAGDAPPAVTDFVLRSMEHARRVAGVCMGAFVLAQAGVLDGRPVTTHWAAARELQARYPTLKVESDRIFIVDGKVWTSAGASAAVDLAVGMIERDLGDEVARLVSKNLVLYHRRGGGQTQHSALLEMGAKSDRIQKALDYAKRNLAKPIGVDDLADAVSLSPRQFSRAFLAETGLTPAKAVENLRLEAARLMMEQTRHPIETIASQTGFGDRERMRRAFVRVHGHPPQAMRRTTRSNAVTN